MTNQTSLAQSCTVHSQLRFLVVVWLLSLSCGCSSFPTSIQIPIAADDVDRWSGRINSMPVEIHDGATSSVTVARFDAPRRPDCQATANLPANPPELTSCGVPRVVVYVGAREIPERTQFCSDTPKLVPTLAAPTEKIFVHAGLCDGQRTVSVARRAVQAPVPTDLNPIMGAIRADLLEALWPETNIEDSYPTTPAPPSSVWIGTF